MININYKNKQDFIEEISENNVKELIIYSSENQRYQNEMLLIDIIHSEPIFEIVEKLNLTNKSIYIVKVKEEI